MPVYGDEPSGGRSAVAALNGVQVAEYGGAANAPAGGLTGKPPPPAGPAVAQYTFGAGRQSEPRSWTPYLGGGIGIQQRRRVSDPMAYDTPDRVSDAVRTNPANVMLDLPAMHPSVGLAQWNALRLMFQKEKWGFKAVAADGTELPDGSEDDAELARILSSSRSGGCLPLEVGSVTALMSQLTSHMLLTGLCMVEVEPNQDELDGARRIWPIDTTTVGFGRATRSDDMQPFQRQRWPRPLIGGTAPQPVNSPPPVGAGFGLALTGWVPLDPIRTFWATIDAGVDDAYGLAPYASGLGEVLCDLALMRDLRDAVHNAAWPRLEVGLNLTELHRVAVEVYRITDPIKASAWVQARFKETVDYVGKLAADDNVVHDSSGRVDTKQPGSFQGLEGVLNFLRQRLVQALKSLPTLMGVSEGTTNNNSVEYVIYAAGLEAVRDISMDMVAEAATLCMRLKGLTSVVKPFSQRIRTNDSLVEANTEEVVIRNAAAKEALGFVDHDEASRSVTGRKAVAPAEPGAIDAMIGKVAEPDGDQSSGKSQTGAAQGNPDAGKTPDEKGKGGKT